MKRKMTRTQHIEEAANALSDLNTFGIVVSVLEGGHTHALCQRQEFAIIKMAHATQQRLLKIYDRHVAAAAE